MTESKRIACVIPPFYRLVESKNNRISPAMHYIAQILYQRGHNVLLINGDYADDEIENGDRVSILLNNWLFAERYKYGHESYDEVLSELQKFSPDIVFIGAGDILIPTVEIGSSQSCIFLAKQIKKFNKNIKCIGYGFLLKYISCADQQYFDAIIIGEGEKQAIQIVEENRQGVLAEEWTDEMDSLPILSHQYLLKRPLAQDWDYIMSMRGCMHKCMFCHQPSLRKGKISEMSAKRFLREVEYRITNYGTSGFYFLDMIFLPNSSKRTYEMLEGLIELKKKYPQFYWWAEARCNIKSTWNKDILAMLPESGCKHLKFGVEATDDSMLERLNKGITYSQIKETFSLVRALGINTTAYVLLGCPGFCDNDYKRMWIKFKNLSADNYVININVPYPGTKLYSEMEERLGSNSINNIEDLTHTSEIMRKFWGIKQDTVDMYFSLEGKKDDSVTRKYIRKVVDRNIYKERHEIVYI